MAMKARSMRAALAMRMTTMFDDVGNGGCGYDDGQGAMMTVKYVEAGPRTTLGALVRNSLNHRPRDAWIAQRAGLQWRWWR
eukprot:6023992-Pyramimonas_sp.AAC.1